MREKTIRNDVIKIVVANIFSQGLLLIVTGTFWDDWFYYYRDRAGLWKEFMEAGRPSSAYWIEAVWSIPHYGYRWLVFSLFTFTALIFYAIMRSSEMFSSEEALKLSILYTVIPVNDARIILCTFSYAVGLTAFLVGVYVLEMYMKDKANKKFCLRIVALSFFGYSFIIQSLLIFYGAVLSYIFYCEYQSRRKYLETIRTMIKYMDFILLPIFFWVGKQMLFPAYGAFENYNAVTMGAVAKAAFRLPLAVIKQAERNWIGIFDFALSGNIVLLFTVFFVVMVCLRFVVRLKEELNFGVDLKKYGGEVIQNPNLQKLVLGIFLFAVGLYPYNVVRRNDEVVIVGVESRDSLLLAFGMALMLYFLLMLLFRNAKIKQMIYGILILCCCSSCICHYLNYQRDAYWQESLISKLRLNENVREASNILFLSNDVSGINGTRFYTLNGAASVAYGDQRRLFLTEGMYELLRDKKKKDIYVESRQMLMNEYDSSNNELDGVIVYDCDIGYKECAILKFYELTEWNSYRENIEKMGILEYYSADSREAKEAVERIEVQ